MVYELVLRMILLLTLLIAAPVACAAATGETASSEAGAAVTYTRAAVTLDGEVLFHVRGFTSLPAEERARGVHDRIRAIAEDASIPVNALHTVEMADQTDILAGEQWIMRVLDADGALEGIPRAVVAEVQRKRIAQAIETYRHDRDPRVLLISTAYALGATLLFVLLIFGCWRGFRRLDTFIERRFLPRVEGLQAKSYQLIQANLVWKSARSLFQWLQIFLVLVAAYLYLNLILGLFPWTRALAGKQLALFLDPLRDMGMGLLAAVPGLAFVVILVVVTRYLLKLTRLFFTSIEHGTITFSGFENDWAIPTYKIVRLFIIALALVMAYPHIPGSNSDAFKGVSILIGVIFSLGSSSFVANLIAGYSVIYRRAFKVGDRIQVNDIIGDVTEIRLMVTHLRTIKNEEITIPNGLIFGSHVINYCALARSRGLILHTTVGIGYETSWRQVEAMLRLAAERTHGLLQEPAPFVRQKSLGDFAVTYEINVYCNDPHAMGQIYTALHQNILDVFNEYGVQIMTPVYEADPAQAKVVSREQWYAAPACTPRIDAASDTTPDTGTVQ